MSADDVLLIFDLDGTLIDSRRDLADSANLMLDSYGAPPMPQDAIVRMVGCGAATLVQRVITAAGVDAPADEALSRFLAIYDGKLVDYTRPYDGIPELLDELAARRGVTLHLLTNKPLAQSLRILERFGFSGNFRHCLGGDGPFPRKPSPEPVRFLMSEAQTSSANTILVGDSSIDLQTARAAGVGLCLARYGFGFADIAPGDLKPDDWVVDTPGEIDGIIDAARRT